jgi:hypothetical protein
MFPLVRNVRVLFLMWLTPSWLYLNSAVAEIGECYVGGYKDYCLLMPCSLVKFTLLSRKWRQHVLTKRWFLSTKLYIITSLNKTIFSCCCCCCCCCCFCVVVMVFLSYRIYGNIQEHAFFQHISDKIFWSSIFMLSMQFIRIQVKLFVCYTTSMHWRHTPFCLCLMSSAA